MSAAIRYLNTDLDLLSAADLTSLTTGLEAMGFVVLHCEQDGGGPMERYIGSRRGYEHARSKSS
jgi:hypothetical protein